MAYQYVVQRFTGGFTSDASPVTLDMQGDLTLPQVSSVTDMLFERGLAIARPSYGVVGNTPAVPIPAAQDILAVARLPFVNPGTNSATALAAKGSICLSTTAAPVFHLWALNTNGLASDLFDPTEITGPGISAGGWSNVSPYFSAAVANRAVLIGGYNGGLVRWDPAAGYVYTVINTAMYAYVASQYSRAIAAYKLTGAATDPITFAWSVPGDEANWSGLGAGSQVLSDIPDAITGLGCLRNVVVVPRTYGFHLGYPTGTFPLVYNFTNFSNGNVGCAYPGTFAVYDDRCFFVGVDGIFSFDLTNVEDIGEGVYKEILTLIRGYSGTPRGFITGSYDLDNRPSYNIIVDVLSPISQVDVACLHYSYDLRERKWTRHFYANPTSTYSTLTFPFTYALSAGATGGSTIQNAIGVAPRKSGSTTTFQLWNTQGTVKPAPTFTTGQFTVGQSIADVEMDRILLFYFLGTLGSGSPTFTITVSSVLNGITQTPIVKTLTGVANVWDRAWVSLRIPGQIFQVTVACPHTVQMKEMVMEFSTSGKERK